MRPVVHALPDRWLAYLDYHLRPGLRNSWGGPFNGQKARQQVVLDLLQTGVRAVIETGTYRGTTTDFFALNAGVRVHTVESSPRYFHYSRLRFRSQPRVDVRFGNSPEVLRQLGTDRAIPKRGVFFYLDAHWRDNLPLKEELEAIWRYWTDSIIMIDDFEVPGDPGYEFDDYGVGRRLSLDYLSAIPDFNKQVYFPTTPSTDETGRKRGYVVLGEGAASSALAGIEGLRLYSGDGAVLSIAGPVAEGFR
jgi:hypothetical protein